MTRAHRMIVDALDGAPRDEGELYLSMPPPSLNNAFVNAGRMGRIKSAAYTAWRTKAHLELRQQGPWHVPGPVYVRIWVNRKETRADLDNIIKPTLDLLVSAGRMEDDRNVVSICATFDPAITGTRIEIERAGGKFDREAA